MKRILVNTSPEKSLKEWKNVFGINNQPRVGYKPRFIREKKWFGELAPRYLRHHDAPLENAGLALFDVSRIFPLFHLDENDPKNYYFADTDDFLSTLEDKSIEIDFRLGESIDHSGFGRRVAPPADFEKWARICKNIIAHYKDGANGGMHLNITRLTIWEEPDTYPELFTGSFDQYMELFATAYRVLHEAFPDVLIGAHVFNRFNDRDGQKEYFLDGCKKYGIVPGFVSLTFYSREPQDITNVAEDYAARLKKYGFDDTELIITEWHLGPVQWGEAGHYGDNGFDLTLSAAYSASALIRLTDIPVLKAAFFYSWGTGIWSVLTQKNGKLVRRPVYYGLKFYSELMRGCTERVDVLWEEDPNVSILAGRTEDGGMKMLISCYHAEDAQFSIDGTGYSSCYIRSVRDIFDEQDCLEGEDIAQLNGSSRFFFSHIGGSAVYLLELEP